MSTYRVTFTLAAMAVLLSLSMALIGRTQPLPPPHTPSPASTTRRRQLRLGVDCSLREAVIAANGTPIFADSITLSAGTYPLPVPAKRGRCQHR
jgi:hypothetical protein